MRKWIVVAGLVVLTVRCLYQLSRLQDLDLIQINTRRSYYPPPLGQLFQNKLTHSLTLSRQALFSSLPWP